MRLLLLLLGTEYLRTRWLAFALLGAVWILAGVVIVLDALDGVQYFPLRLFGWLLVVEAGIGLAIALAGIALRPVLRGAWAALTLLTGLLLVLPFQVDHLVLALLFGLTFAADGLFRIAAAWMVRFPGWRTALAGGALEILFAASVMQPWPSRYLGTVPICLALVLALSGWTLARVGWRLRRLRPQASLGLLYARGHFLREGQLAEGADLPVSSDGAELTVHVWTALGTASDPRHRPLIDRYIAAVDHKGVVSTGHSALDLPPDLYVSHYPAIEIDHAPDDFARLLRATAENDVPGRFLPSYTQEAADWCPSTEQVRFCRFDAGRLRRFWEVYRRDATYNLTNRNCSSAVAHALEIALEGTLGRPDRGLRHAVRVLMSTEFWAASILRQHAESMAWTPGLVLDYARNLQALENPPRLSAHAVWRMLRHPWRRGRALRRHQRPRSVTAL
ncbi:HdeD family acid-resistance protein [Geminicoccus roseus]|uniref:HdeD family acid-resistance protein n=1 Tax=Geminicoccus roseus TaxID=404900 RepID=UPI0004105B28|nr:hypothetical protein [Geminicoccus roseus]